MATTYEEAGVDQAKAGRLLSSFATYLKSRPQDPNLLTGIGPFASCYSIKNAVKGLQDPVLVTSCDGVGTKSMLALEWGHLDDLGIDLVAMNVNDLLCVGALPVAFLDYYACGKLDEAQLLTLLKSIQKGCEIAGCSLAGGETAEMPGLYSEKDFDLAGFAAGIAEASEILGPSKVGPNDQIWAIESSGIHSNGYSLVRKILKDERIRPEEKASFSDEDWKTLLLRPTRIYVPLLKPFLSKVHALAHLTGGGLFENLPRVLPQGTRAILLSELWEIPALFSWFQKKAGLSTEQLLSTFNAGVGMLVVCDGTVGSELAAEAKARGLRCWQVGRLEEDEPLAPARVIWK